MKEGILMKEKNLIVSDNKKIVKKIKIILIVSFILFLACLVSFCWGHFYEKQAAEVYDSCNESNKYLNGYLGKYYNYKDCMEEKENEYPLWSVAETPRVVGFLGLFVFTPTTILLLLLYLMSNKMELIITDKRVYGKSVFGKRVDLPVDSISSISKNLFHGITVSTSSGKIKWYMLDGKEEAYNTLEKLIINRQAKVENNFDKVNVADELKKYKELLDSGAITEEEYNKKKKELLNL
jgi:hypothetical protein